MPDEPRVQELLDELSDREVTPEEVCGDCPELLGIVRERWRQICRARSELDALLPIWPHGALPSTPPEELALPQVPGYEVEAVLGRGGMGMVYRAWQHKLNRTVALKTLIAGACAGPAARVRFQREAEALAGICHANIVQVYEVNEYDGRPYITMELIAGGSLAQKLADSPTSPRQAAELVASLAEAVAVAHGAGIVHRDLKPSNILLAADGTPKISDFGLARRVEGEDQITWTGTAVGTPSYMAPEQASAGQVGPAADVYGLGAILYELLTGRPPFRGRTVLETLRQVLAEEPLPPSRLNSGVPRDLETVCLKCLQKDPRRRYLGAAALAADLRRFLVGRVVEARPVSNWERAGKWVRRNPAIAGLSATAILALVAGTTASLLFAIEAGRQAEVAKDRTAKLKRQSIELEAQTRAANQSAQRAREKEDEVTRVLVSGLLSTLGRDQPELGGRLDGADGEVMRQLRATPEPVRLQFLDAALRDSDSARRVGRLADWTMHTIVGCDRALRDEVEQRIVRRIREPDAPQDLLLACARLGLSINIKDREWAERSADAVIVALGDPATSRNDYANLAEALAALCEILPPERAGECAAQVIDVFFPNLQCPEATSEAPAQLGQAVVAISPWLDQDAAAHAATALGAGIRQSPSRPWLWEPFAKAQAAVCHRLPPLDASIHESATVDWLIERCGVMPDQQTFSYSFRAAEALLPLCGHLDADRARRVTETMLAVLGDRERFSLVRTMPTVKADFTACAEALEVIAERMDAQGNALAADELIRVLRKTESKVLAIEYEQLNKALLAMCRGLDAAGAERIAAAAVDAVGDRTTSAGFRTIFANALMAVREQLDPVRADTVESAVVDALVADLAELSLLPAGELVCRTVAAVSGRSGAQGATRMADALMKTIGDPQTTIELLPLLVEALGAAGGRLPPEEASRRANEVIALLSSRQGVRTLPAERIVLAEATVAAWTGVDSFEASAHAEGTIAELADLLRDSPLAPLEQALLLQALVPVYGHLGHTKSAARPKAVVASQATKILAALQDPTNNLALAARVSHAKSLLALGLILDPPDAARLLDALFPTLSDLDKNRVPFNAAGGLAYDSIERRIKRVLSRLDDADVGRILEHPFAVGELQRIVLEVLGETEGRTYRNTWDYLDRTMAPRSRMAGMVSRQ